jgi:hypothetical protein
MQIVKKLRFTGPVFLISGATGAGTRPLCQAIMTLLEDVAAGRESEVTGGYELPKAPVKPASPRKATIKKAVIKTAVAKRAAKKSGTKAGGRNQLAAARRKTDKVKGKAAVRKAARPAPAKRKASRKSARPK